MPRRARVDFPGALHHVMMRGIEKRCIFRDDRDRQAFVERLAKALRRGKGRCLAWALLPNHFHLLLASGEKPVGKVMQSLGTAYALYFNRRHQRSGHLFQNRYKSVLCEREPYLLELVRYIHLNPLRAGVVSSLQALERYPWSGHAVLVGSGEVDFQEREEVLSLFAQRQGPARQCYREFVEQGVAHGHRSELTGGGLVRSLGGWEGVREARRKGDRQMGDERILGSGEFVGEVLRTAEQQEKKTSRLRRNGWTPDKVLRKAAAMAEIPVADLRGGGKRAAQCRGRALACKWLTEDLGMKGVDAARLLGISHTAVRRCVHRGLIEEKKGEYSFGSDLV